MDILIPTFKNEKHFTASIRKAAQQLGWMEYHTGHVPHQDFRNSTSPGFPDLVLAKPNHMVIFAELKMPKGKLTEHQKQWEQVLRSSAGCMYFIWRPEDWDSILDLLQQ